ncbi:AcrR family transcriptional regulator [Bifidobacterium goeldii]|uniref:AcrR family transcriptional regulator n=1 Tax=Bifidobacterium goeldii TaxID=2306975 RepID=A0A430FLK9_9BIFI|nr:TetR/AcrR family transcriptional regulator [Bifidobacterium goeldii]RSX53631.1 AcrR family transcriptional regulator [Bifidobacterium goeldii]
MAISSVGDARREQIVQAARAVCLETGFDKLTISDIASRVGMTRSLFYHYFPDKDAVADAVLDDVISDMLSKLERWNATREVGNITKALDDIVRLTRSIIADESPFSNRLMHAGNAGLYIRFVDRAVTRISDYICDSVVLDFERLHGLPIKNVHETFFVLIVGLISLLRTHPNVDDATLKNLIAQSLHIDSYV